ncbi:hypothetical protein CIC12_22925 [Burkholderia sp. SG-MS1]|nr:hypothetical protein [Paraburkholderia sp. SG-MS1]
MTQPRSRGRTAGTTRRILKVNQKVMSQFQWQQIGSMQFGPRGDPFQKVALQHPSAMTATSLASRWSQI